MLIEQIAIPGSLRILFELIKTAIRQIPTVFEMISTAPTVAIQIGAMAVIVTSAGGIVFIAEKISKIIKKLNDKL